MSDWDGATVITGLDKQKFHVEGRHKMPIEGHVDDHYYVCSHCRPDAGYTDDGREVEVFHLPQSAAADPMAAIKSRLGL